VRSLRCPRKRINPNVEADELKIARLKDMLIEVNVRNRQGLDCVFTIAHLFGHFVQFSRDDRYESLTRRVETVPARIDDALDGTL
jgi:hypothetical protein